MINEQAQNLINEFQDIVSKNYVNKDEIKKGFDMYFDLIKLPKKPVEFYENRDGWNAARNATWNTSRNIAWDTAWNAARYAAWNAARNATWNTSRVIEKYSQCNYIQSASNYPHPTIPRFVGCTIQKCNIS